MGRTPRCRWLVLLTTALSLAPRVGDGQAPPRARFELIAGRDTARCPTEPDLRAAVAARMGRDPFDPNATALVRVRIERAGTEYRATIQQFEGTRRLGQRVLAGRRADCSDLGAALALAVGLSLDPLANPPAPPPVEPTPTPQPSAPPPPPPQPSAEPEPAVLPAPIATPVPPPAPPPPRTPVRGLVGVEAVATFASLPAPSLGPGAFGSLRYGRFAAQLAARYDLGFSSPIANGGELHASLVLGSAQVCVLQPFARRGEFEACALGAVGALAASATSLDRAPPVTNVYAGVGGSVGATLRLNGWLGLRLHLDGVVTVVRVRHYLVEGGAQRDVWLAPPASLVVGIGPVLHFD